MIRAWDKTGVNIILTEFKCFGMIKVLFELIKWEITGVWRHFSKITCSKMANLAFKKIQKHFKAIIFMLMKMFDISNLNEKHSHRYKLTVWVLKK